MMKKIIAVVIMLAVSMMGAGIVGKAYAQILPEEREALIALYDSTDGVNWTDKNGWNGEVGTECSWTGITCEENHVTKIELSGKGLNGNIPDSLISFSVLKTLNLSDNHLYGTISGIGAWLGNLSNSLEYLSLSNNQLYGGIPSELGNLYNLLYLDLSYNKKPEVSGSGISSPIPNLSNLTNLTHLNLSGNLLSGSIPTELGKLTNLGYLALSENQLTGSIPDLSNLKSLTHLVLSGNQLSGGIPATLGSLSSLTYLELSNNSLEGSIPKEIGDLINLEHLLLNNNALAGDVPNSLMSLKNLKDNESDFCNNGLFTSDAALSEFLNKKQEGDTAWENCQNNQFIFGINVWAGDNGTINPSGTMNPSGEPPGYWVWVNKGERQTFTFAPDTGYAIEEVKVDEKPVGTPSDYTFENVIAGRSISVTFKRIQHKITVSAGANGMAKPAGDPPGEVWVIDGTEQSFSFIPDAGYEVDTVTVDDKVFSAISEYSFENVVADHTISATFKLSSQPEYTLTATHTTNANYIPGKTLTVTNQITYTGELRSLYFTFDLPEGWTFISAGGEDSPALSPDRELFFYWTTPPASPIDFTYTVTVSDTAVGEQQFSAQVQYWRFEEQLTQNVQPNPLIINSQHKITVSAGANGMAEPAGDPPGQVWVTDGGSQTFTFTPAEGYEVDTVIADNQVFYATSQYSFENVVAEHIISVSFKAIEHVIAASAGENGEIDPSGDVIVKEGEDKQFTFTSDAGYEIEDVKVDEISVGTETTYTFTDVAAVHSIHVSFRAIEHVITASAGANGIIQPSGIIMVSEGASQDFTFGPNPGYIVEDIEVDGESQGPMNSYTFMNVNADHTISATFKDSTIPPLYVITVSAGDGGSINPDGDVVVSKEGSRTFTFSPDAGYTIDEVKVDDLPVTVTENSYTFSNVTANHSLSVSFKVVEYIITASAGEGGEIGPAGNVGVSYGESKTFSILPKEGYEIQDVLVDGKSAGTVSSYTFTNVTAVHTISATFKAVGYVISTSAGDGGEINPAGNVGVSYDESKTFSILPLEGYEIQDVLVDGKSVGNVSSYIFKNVVENHTISAVFVKKAESVYTIIADAGDNGSIYPSGYISVLEGGAQSFSIYPATGYKIESVTVDGISAGPIDSYTFANVSGSHTIFVSFAPVLVPKIAVFEGGNSVPNGGSVNFGETFAGTPLTKSFIIKNTGTNLLTLSYSLAAENFTILGEIPENIEAGAETSFQIQFKAENVGNFKGTLKFDSSDSSNTPYNLALSAAVTVIPEPEIEVLWNGSLISDNGSFSFDGTVEGKPVTKTFVVKNTGTAKLELDTLQLPQGFSLIGEFPDSIEPAGSSSFQVRLDAEDVGKFTGTLGFDNNDKDENPYQFSLSGEVTPVPVPEIAVFSDGAEIPADEAYVVNFGDTLIGTQPVTKIFTIQNTGTGTLEIGEPDLPMGFRLVGEFPESIAPGKSADVEIQLDTDETGKFTGTLLFETNDSDENPYDFTLTGFVSQYSNNPPETPQAISPANEAAFPEGSVTLEASQFSDPDGDAHQKTYWQIRQSDGVVRKEMTAENLEQLTLSDFASGLKYVWKVQYEDERGGISSWSEERNFKVGVSEDVKIEVGPGTVTADFKMVPFVHLPDDPAPEQIFGVGDYDTTLFRIGTYNPAKGGYDEYGSGLGNVEPGKAYWVFSRNKHTIRFSGIPVSKIHEIEIPLSYNPDVEKGGWNMIACPNDADYDWKNVKVLQYGDNGEVVKGPVSVSEENDLVEKELWEWEKGTYYYGISTMVRNKGYWVKVKQKNVFLKFPNAARIQGNAENSRQAASRYDDSPPAPISSFTDGAESRINEGGGGGCFIDSLF